MNSLTCLIRYSYFLWSIYLLTHKESDSRIERVKKATNKCGPLGIKLLQFIIMRNTFKTKELNFFLEKCAPHNLEETKKLFYKDFGKDLESEYKIDPEPIGSGSIGQVYKLYSIKDDTFIAMKVKHPGIDKQIVLFSKSIKILTKIFYNWKWKYLIHEFINNINTQLDYNLEAANTLRLKEYFKNEPIVIVPDVYNSSENFILMEYITGKTFEECENKPIISMYIQYIFMISVLCYDFLHGDLHFGNWKVKDNKIIIYDCSVMYHSNDLDFNKKIMNFVYNGNYRNLLLTFNTKDKTELIEKCIKEIDLLDNETAGNRIKNFLMISLKYKLLTDKYIIDLLNCVCILGETKKISVDIYTKYIFTRGDSNAVMLYTHIDLLNKMGIFNDLKVFFEKWMEEDPDNKITHTNWLLDNFGHTDSTIISDIIYEKLIT
jgi:predicted unusual protein kinase regulating ubiquinone biosynthesis (AarF/ABC1/UbiB family)